MPTAITVRWGATLVAALGLAGLMLVPPAAPAAALASIFGRIIELRFGVVIVAGT